MAELWQSMQQVHAGILSPWASGINNLLALLHVLLFLLSGLASSSAPVLASLMP
jgi:hypothetical protein